MASPELPRTDRREFLARCSAAASGLLLGGVAEAAGAPAGQPAASGYPAGGAPAAPLPTIRLGPHQVSRLVVGSNPISGYSYLGRERDQEMKAYFTPERTLAMLQQCERLGINTHQYSLASKATEVYRKLRQQGSKLQLIGLHRDVKEIKPMLEANRPIALAHHGGVTDKLFREGRGDRVHDFVKAVHDQGLLAGVSAHNPDNIKRIADEGWQVDFFMTCFYFLTREKPPAGVGGAPPAIEGSTEEKTFYKADPPAMCAVIRQVRQPCLAFKILGAGRLCASQEIVRAAFRFAFTHIKPIDAVIVGMYPRRLDQPRADADYARELA
ncbi:MAG: hypothetical protein ABSG86_29790 [Thermoguttaceae bacterium]|jgi:hypothetical protein